MEEILARDVEEEGSDNFIGGTSDVTRSPTHPPERLTNIMANVSPHHLRCRFACR